MGRNGIMLPQGGALASYATSAMTSPDLGVTASTYASFAEIMTGFSFAALAIYLAYESAKGAHSAEAKAGKARYSDRKNRRNTKENDKQENPIRVGKKHPIRRTEVAATLFYGMASLAMSSFLYASLTTQVGDPQKVAAVLLLYGVIFGTSVLTFFYSLTLMTYENPDTKGAARAAYLVVVIVGPAVVLRFLADAAQGAWNTGCSGCTPESWPPPLIGGIALLGILLIFSVLVSQTHILERWRTLYGVCNWLCVRPVLPAMVIFLFTASVAIAAMVVTEPLNYIPSELFIWVSLFVGFVLLALFALACGCVVGPRLSSLPVIRAWLAGDEADLQYLADTLPAGDVQVAKDGQRYYMTAVEMDNSPVVAWKLITRINGLARTRNPAFGPVKLTGAYDQDRGVTGFLPAAQLASQTQLSATAGVINSDGLLQLQSHRAEPDYLACAAESTDVANVLEIMGQPRALHFPELYKVYEIMQHAGVLKVAMELADVSHKEMSQFTRTANHQAVVGANPQHQELPQQVPLDPMRIDRARAMIGTLVIAWLLSLNTRQAG
jgi:hypothetical protein